MGTAKKIGAVAVGFLSVVILSVATDTAMEMGGIFPPASEQKLYVTWMLAVAFLYRSVYAVAGGYVAAALSPEHPERQVKILAILGTLGGTAGVIYGWSMVGENGWTLIDLWYPVALAVTAYPLTQLGGRMRIKK